MKIYILGSFALWWFYTLENNQLDDYLLSNSADFTMYFYTTSTDQISEIRQKPTSLEKESLM